VNLQLLVTREAHADIAEAIVWLPDVSPTLPPRFAEEIDRIYGLILEHPQMYPSVYKRFRRALLRRFPYSIFYVFQPPLLLIAGVIHQSRDDSSRKKRA
jgi:plasmid stabilization system protein ParE